MRHLKKGWKLKRTRAHRKALLRNLAISLIEHKKIVTTVAKAKALRPFVEKIITRAKRAILRERNGQLPEGQTVDIHARRIVGRLIHNKAVLQELFDTVAPAVIDRPGGYTRIVKLGFRRGDAAELAAIELVDWSAPQDGAVSLKSKKKTTSKKQTLKKSKVKEKKTEETVPVPITDEAPSQEQTKPVEGSPESSVEPTVEGTITRTQTDITSAETDVNQPTQEVSSPVSEEKPSQEIASEQQSNPSEQTEQEEKKD